MPRTRMNKSHEANIYDFKTGEKQELTTREIFGENLRYLRRKAGLQQSDVSSKLGVDRSAVSAWERGLTRPDLENLFRLCSVLHVSPNILFNLGDGISERDRRFLTLYHTLTDEDQNFVDRMVFELSKKNGAARTYRTLTEKPIDPKAAAAGFGDASECQLDPETMLLCSTPLIDRADYVKTVNGSSMEPLYHNGDLVLVERVSPSDMAVGDIGIFYIDNEDYIKKLGENELISLNPAYSPMLFSSYDHIGFGGRVIGIVSETDLPTQEERNHYDYINS